ncbi:MAG: hypothetical protein M5U26_01260 [Planctomycetota bacterium]|nr:hypothetical protein [Planctomycetota bacterium]
MPSHAYLPRAFAQTVADAVPGMLAHQQPDGCLRYAPDAPIVYPQQAIFPLAFCYAGLDPERKHTGDAKLLDAIRRLGAFLEATYNQQGEFEYDSYGIKVKGVDQRLTYAWVEALRILREVGADCAYDAWSAKILRACETLIEHRLAKLVGLTRFVGRVTGTSINHVSLYLTTLYRAGTVLGRKDLADLALPMARALAADVHPDGYWEEHGDLLRNGGPTPSYNYLTHCAIGLFRAWTGEDVFLRALERSTRFHGNFSYPDASFFELIDERVRHGKGPRVWGLFGFSHWDFGRGMARAKFEGWRAGEGDLAATSPRCSRGCARTSSTGSPAPKPPPPSPGRTTPRASRSPADSSAPAPGPWASAPCTPPTPRIPPTARTASPSRSRSSSASGTPRPACSSMAPTPRGSRRIPPSRRTRLTGWTTTPAEARSARATAASSRAPRTSPSTGTSICARSATANCALN